MKMSNFKFQGGQGLPCPPSDVHDVNKKISNFKIQGAKAPPITPFRSPFMECA